MVVAVGGGVSLEGLHSTRQIKKSKGKKIAGPADGRAFRTFRLFHFGESAPGPFTSKFFCVDAVTFEARVVRSRDRVDVYTARCERVAEESRSFAPRIPN
jgi:hypothetical protein